MVDLECNEPKIFNKTKSIINEDACLKYLDETKPLYLETHASRVGLGASLLQTRYNTSCPRDGAPDSNILRPIAFAIKSLTSVQKDTAK